MRIIAKQVLRLSIMLFSSILVASCVTETVESPSMKFKERAVISVGDPNAAVLKGSTFAWLPKAVQFYEDERLDNKQLKALIEQQLVSTIKQKEMIFVDSVNGAQYAIAYTAALESSLADETIIRRYGLLPGMADVPEDDKNIEKGSLIVYVFENKYNTVIWRSAAQVGVEFDMSMEKRKERVIRVVAEMFQTFPVQQ
jgi:hypothetical protein